jgi:hypothetical protein
MYCRYLNGHHTHTHTHTHTQGGRAGGLAAADALCWHSLPCGAGSVWLFNGWYVSLVGLFYLYNRSLLPPYQVSFASCVQVCVISRSLLPQ